MTLSDTKHRAASLRQLRFLHSADTTARWRLKKKGSLGESKYRKGGGEHDGIEKKVTVLHLDFCLVLNVSCVCVVCFGHC